MSGNTPVAEAVDASRFRIAVVAARYNGAMVDALLARVEGELARAGVRKGRLTVTRVPGSNELPLAARLLIGAGRPDAVVALGVIIRGATLHFELVAEAASRGLMDVGLATRVPVINGVIAADTAAQARERCSGRINRGAEFASAALSMARLSRSLRR
ncbi:MAG TPA: 6,7-dimethyl-8-ribityllumazine synthase [Opitutaceae bacterium]|jgi:6,7-dimethyl-8-ribityllumazine synthase